MNKNFLIAAFILHFFCFTFFAQNIYKEYSAFDFKCGKNILFEDNINFSNTGNWKVISGEISGSDNHEGNFISINKYYTVLEPNTERLPSGNDIFTVEFDTYLDSRYEGNPGVFITFNNNSEINATLGTLANYIQFDYNGEKSSFKHPAEIYENKYYNRWHHYSVLYKPGKMLIYADRFKVAEINNCYLTFDKISVCGNSSEDYAMYFRNIRICSDEQLNIADELNAKGKITTHSITYNKDNSIKPESMGFINELIIYLKQNTGTKLKIKSVSDVNSDEKNLQIQADNIRSLLTEFGIDKNRVITEGILQTNTSGNNTTSIDKVNNNFIEIELIKN